MLAKALHLGRVCCSLTVKVYSFPCVKICAPAFWQCLHFLFRGQKQRKRGFHRPSKVQPWDLTALISRWRDSNGLISLESLPTSCAFWQKQVTKLKVLWTSDYDFTAIWFHLSTCWIIYLWTVLSDISFEIASSLLVLSLSSHSVII